MQPKELQGTFRRVTGTREPLFSGGLLDHGKVQVTALVRPAAERLRRWEQGSVASVLRPQQTADEDISESGWVRDIEVSTPMRHSGSQHVAEIALIPAVRGEGMHHWSAPPRLLLR